MTIHRLLQLELPLLPALWPPSAKRPANLRERDGQCVRQIQLGQQILSYRLKRSARRTIGFCVDESGLAVTAPRRITLAGIESAIAAKQRWIFTKLADQQNQAQRALPPMQWRDGATLPFLGQPLRIKISSSSTHLPSDKGTLHDAPQQWVLTLVLPPAQTQPQHIEERVHSWLHSEAKRLFLERLDLYAARLGMRYRACALSSATTRWGSCSSNGTIRLHWRLIHFPLHVIDYVVAHELAHLREMNHGPRFWRIVEALFPDYRNACQILREHSPQRVPFFFKLGSDTL